MEIVSTEQWADIAQCEVTRVAGVEGAAQEAGAMDTRDQEYGDYSLASPSYRGSPMASYAQQYPGQST